MSSKPGRRDRAGPFFDQDYGRGGAEEAAKRFPQPTPAIAPAKPKPASRRALLAPVALPAGPADFRFADFGRVHPARWLRLGVEFAVFVSALGVIAAALWGFR